MHAIEESARSPLKLVELPPQLALEEAREEGEFDELVCPDCGKEEMDCECP